jgi:hypothetical protein
MIDYHLEPPEPTNNEDVCSSCEYRDCICDLAHERQREADLDYQI